MTTICCDNEGNLILCPYNYLASVQGEIVPRDLPLDGSDLAGLVEVGQSLLALEANLEFPADGEDADFVVGALALAKGAVTIASRAVGEALLLVLRSGPSAGRVG